MNSRYMQLKESGELRKIRQFRNMTTEERYEHFERVRNEKLNKKNAHSQAIIRLIDAHSSEHRSLIKEERDYLSIERGHRRNRSDKFLDTEAQRRASVVLRYDHSYEYSRYYDQELLAMHNGFRSVRHQRTEKRRVTRKRISVNAFAVASVAIFAGFGFQAFMASERRGEQLAYGEVDPEFTVVVGPFNIARQVSGVTVSVDEITGATDEELAEMGVVTAMSSDMEPVRNDHGGERRPIPSDPTKRCPEFEDMFAQYGMLPIETWSYIAWRESRCNPRSQNAEWDENGNMTYHLNKNKTYDTGLLQINSSWRSVIKDVCGDQAVENYMAGLKDPVCNIMVARYIMEHSAGGLANWRM